MRRALSPIANVLTGALCALGFMSLVLLARYAVNEAFQQDVSAFRRWTFRQ